MGGGGPDQEEEAGGREATGEGDLGGGTAPHTPWLQACSCPRSNPA